MYKPNRLVSVTFLLFTLLFGPGSASNYDAYLMNLATEGNELRGAFIRENPRGQDVWDRISSPDYVDNHPVLGESLSGPHEINEEDWKAFLAELKEARSEAALAQENGLSQQTRRNEPIPVKTGSVEQNNPKYDELSDQLESASRRNEVAYQNQLWGEHRVTGGSSEIGQWLDYALVGAGAQDLEENSTNPSTDDDKFRNEAVLALPRMSFKVDKLPAYCDPPNPCPIGYDPDSLATPCDEHIEDTKEFNQEWIYNKLITGECSCDIEHMWRCPSARSQSSADSFYGPAEDEEVEQHALAHRAELLNPYMRGQKRSQLVAKKSIQKRSVHMIPANHPYMRGQILKTVVKKAGPRRAHFWRTM